MDGPRGVREAFAGHRFRVEVESWPEGDREVARSPSASAVVAVTPARELLLVRQPRRSIRQSLLEVPAGLVEDGEDFLGCAARELREETGYAAASIEFLGEFFASAGWTDERYGLFVAATDPEPAGEPDHEIDELVRMPWSQAAEAARAGRFRDAKTCLGILLATARLDRGAGDGVE